MFKENMMETLELNIENLLKQTNNREVREQLIRNLTELCADMIVEVDKLSEEIEKLEAESNEEREIRQLNLLDKKHKKEQREKTMYGGPSYVK